MLSQCFYIISWRVSGKIEKHEVYQVDNYHVISSAEPSSGRIMYYYDDIDEDGDSEDVGDLHHKSMICWVLKMNLGFSNQCNAAVSPQKDEQ